MVDLLLLAGRLLLVALLYLFLFFVVKTGVGLVRGQNKKEKSWTLNVEKGPRTLKGVRLTIAGPIVIGRAPGADIVIPTDYVSARHARFSLSARAFRSRTSTPPTAPCSTGIPSPSLSPALRAISLSSETST